MAPFDFYTVGSVLLVGVISALAALILGRRTAWSERKITWVAAAPIPALAGLLSILFTVDAMYQPKERCGVDACGMAMIAAFSLFILAGLAFVLAVMTARLGYWISKR